MNRRKTAKNHPKNARRNNGEKGVGKTENGVERGGNWTVLFKT